MWIMKGAALGLALFSVGTLGFLMLTIRPAGSHSAIGVGALLGMTTGNFLWWTALVASVVLGCCIVGSWPVPVKP